MRQLGQKRNRSAVGRYADESPEGTEFRRLARRVLNLCDPGKPLALMVTSAMRGEGKTTVATNLAIALARSKHRRVLLVDADLRRPQIHNLFGFNRHNGLSEILGGDLNVRAAYRTTRMENLMIITGGRFEKNPSKFFESGKVKEILGEIKADFDVIIFDFPPTIPVSEPEMVGREMDGVLFVFLSGKTPREVGQRGVSILKSAEVNLLGIVVNDLSEVLPYHYRYKYYKYYSAKPEISPNPKGGKS